MNFEEKMKVQIDLLKERLEKEEIVFNLTKVCVIPPPLSKA